MIKYLFSVFKIKLELLDSILLLSSAVIFFKINFAKIVQEHYPNVKPFGSRSGPSGSKLFASVFSRRQAIKINGMINVSVSLFCFSDHP